MLVTLNVLSVYEIASDSLFHVLLHYTNYLRKELVIINLNLLSSEIH